MSLSEEMKSVGLVATSLITAACASVAINQQSLSSRDREVLALSLFSFPMIVSSCFLIGIFASVKLDFSIVWWKGGKE